MRTTLLADLFGTPPVWQEQALCAEVGFDFFFPEGKGASVAEAKQICSMCPVKAECLNYALANAEPYGVWGGLTEYQRRKLRRRTDQQPPAVAA